MVRKSAPPRENPGYAYDRVRVKLGVRPALGLGLGSRLRLLLVSEIRRVHK